MTLRCRSPLSVCLAALACLLCLSLPARADGLQDANKLLKQGQTSQALDKVDQYLATKPKDAQGRFLRGVILTEMNRQQDAIGVFTKLTEDYPELPEPYNNLAVIYAQQKQYEKAKQALEMAIRTHPAYATAHENLGDIYARLASQAYDKAMQLDSSNTSAQSKLAMIRELMGGTRPAVAKTTAAPAGAPAPVKLTETKTEPKPAEAAKAVPADGKAPAPAVVTPPAPSAPGGDVSGEITKAIEGWAAAWSHKDLKNYLAFYAGDFATPGGQSKAVWEAERSKRINKPGTIAVSFENLQVSSDGADRAVAKFRQHYRSASMKTSSNKVLVFAKRNGKWQITQERVGR